MCIFVVSPHPFELASLVLYLNELYPDSEIAAFADPLLAVKVGMTEKVDALYTVIEMNRMDGFGVAKMLKSQHYQMLVNLIADDNKYRSDAMRLGVYSYITRPLSKYALKKAENEVW